MMNKKLDNMMLIWRLGYQHLVMILFLCIWELLLENKKAKPVLAHYGLYHFVGKSNLSIF
ncbi:MULTISPECIES: hypothetical protein [Bacillus]|jgi:hypothetical protein|uniref:hypothetical protein n=2 Tax=Bacillaceae TaxID=186817 RepID=UPI00081FD225|nr:MULTISPECIES: hypothetical protein [Bacillus]AOC57613.1 hypothetical protein BEN31_12745 [Bacillus pumilus]MBR0587790.1 hypothetical protein [Bacillus pumilus DW2J2]MBR0618204.1 hypothetical protein [Bacillus pumilus]MBR0625279.1 hypothetical protein [Bacillus pumilus]MBU5257909.1 hypothetical protein [Bacillus pumilus]